MQKNKVSIQEGQFEKVLAVAFAPVVALSELIKNSSDACMTPKDIIKIYVDPDAHTIRLIDNGYGFSTGDIDSLHEVGFSNKMVENNTVSRIGEPFAGSKGLGILTAFNLCGTLEILTFSQEDQKAYKVVWEKGTAEIVWEEICKKTKGTEFILHDVSDETIRLLIMNEELTKLYLSSINYYIDSETLPQIELYENQELNILTPKAKIEELYHRFKKPSNGFVAKATFKYSNNTLTLSYEDNVKKIYMFENEEINLDNSSSILDFLKRNKISNFRHIDKSNKFDAETPLDDFEGVYYIWRERKHEDMNYPYGVRIYINNYGLYNYLNKDFDWLQHSEISQNIRATNYKLKNTFGYVNFINFNETNSQLKISNERNDFHENLAKKKFFHIMQKFVSGIFSTVDINIKNFDDSGLIKFKKRVNNKTITIGDELRVADLISTNLSLEDITINHPENVTVNPEGNISFTKPGRYNFSFEYEEKIIVIEVLVEDDLPYFELKKTLLKVQENNSENLREQIKKTSIKNLNIEDIEICSDTANITRKRFFTSKNPPGKYAIKYKYSEDLIKTMQLTVLPVHHQKADKLKELFPRSCKKYPKITDLIQAISENYMRCPTLCIIAIRPLVEFALKAFINEFYSEEDKKKIINKDFNVNGALNGLLNRIRTKKLSNLNKLILNEYSDTLIKTGKQIATAFKNLELSLHIHEPDTHATPKEVEQSLKKLKPFLNFIISSLNSKDLKQ